MAREMLEIFTRMATPEAAEQFSGELRIGAIATVQTGLLAAALLRLREAAPKVEPKLIPGVSLNLLSQVDAGELDLAILIEPPFDLPKELHAEILREEDFVLIVPCELEGDDPLRILASQPLVRYDRTSFGGRQVTRFLRRQRLEIQVALELDELDAIVRMVEAGLGVSLIPEAGLWLEREAAIRVIRLGELTFQRRIILLTRHGQRSQPILQLFARCLQGA